MFFFFNLLTFNHSEKKVGGAAKSIYNGENDEILFYSNILILINYIILNKIIFHLKSLFVKFFFKSYFKSNASEWVY